MVEIDDYVGSCGETIQVTETLKFWLIKCKRRRTEATIFEADHREGAIEHFCNECKTASDDEKKYSDLKVSALFEQAGRSPTVTVENKAKVIMTDTFSVYMEFPQSLYDALLAEEKDGKKRVPAKLVISRSEEKDW